MITFPNAKLNIGLNIVSKRKDGYHNIETVFYPVPLYDALEIVPAKQGETTFTQTGLKLDTDAGANLVMKAYRLLAADKAPIDIYLRKNIPFGAGLGGGSADAAFMLKMINEYYGMGYSVSGLEQLALQLGADCPFFINNRPVFAEGTGNIFSSTGLSLKGYYAVLVKPNVYVSTAEAYAGVIPKAPETSIKDIVCLPVESWNGLLRNDFEESVFARYPKIRKTKENLYRCGAVYASMSGSGSSVFGLFGTKPVIPDNQFDGSLIYIMELNGN